LSAAEALPIIHAAHCRFNEEKEVTGEEIQTLLRGGLTVLPIEELMDVADAATCTDDGDDQDRQFARSRMDFFEKVGESLSSQAN